MKVRLLISMLAAFSLFTQAQDKPTIEALGWIAGCWERSSATRVSQEQWMQPAGGTMIGMSRTVSNGKTVEFEHLMLRQEGDKIDYIATPSGQKQTVFRLIKFSVTEVVFENPEHDFPQRIIYRLKDDGSLQARIEGTMNGQERGIDFPFKKVSCDKK